MELKKFRQYKIELVNGSNGTISIPLDTKLQYIIDTRKFIEDAFSETFIRSNSIIKFEYVGIEEVQIQKNKEEGE